ncbi:hypothetical protein WR25_18699 [Diploscapter pachys]|uniref:Uncharacterized protein n=1 Tax=Diploscapter pachys TaxID=2018661 RepID=A0A2A2KFK4_9BILA|nr:hypothetical protein WR25_18699 [Diploscapter pachys]
MPLALLQFHVSLSSSSSLCLSLCLLLLYVPPFSTFLVDASASQSQSCTVEGSICSENAATMQPKRKEGIKQGKKKGEKDANGCGQKLSGEVRIVVGKRPTKEGEGNRGEERKRKERGEGVKGDICHRDRQRREKN